MDTGREIHKQAEPLYNVAAKRIYQMALYMTGIPSAAEQIAIKAFCDAFDRTGDKENIRLFQANAMAAIYRYSRKELGTFHGSTASFALPGADGSERQRIAQMLGRLCLKDRFIVLAFCSQRYSVEQISKMLRLPPALVRKRLNAALYKATDGFHLSPKGCQTT